jgi:hypothetical protein
MFWKVSAVIVGVLGVGGLLYFAALTNPINQKEFPGPVACTMEAKVCPDGTSVGRVGPRCEFAECPVVLVPKPLIETGTTTTELVLRLGEKGSLNGVSIVPLSVVSDSRCPSDPKVQCVWAGTVQVRAKIQSGLGTTETTLELNKEFTTEAESIVLVGAAPAKSVETEIATSTYQFTFQITKRK